MRSRGREARAERRQFRRLTKDLSSLSSLGKPPKPRRHLAKDFLGAAATLAIVGAILLEVTNGLASRCRTGLNPHAGSQGCSGMAAFASHAKGVVTLSVAACAALAVILFVWYMIWGYKTNGQARGPEHTLGP